jgi:hypothetical protein
MRLDPWRDGISRRRILSSEERCTFDLAVDRDDLEQRRATGRPVEGFDPVKIEHRPARLSLADRGSVERSLRVDLEEWVTRREEAIREGIFWSAALRGREIEARCDIVTLGKIPERLHSIKVRHDRSRDNCVRAREPPDHVQLREEEAVGVEGREPTLGGLHLCEQPLGVERHGAFIGHSNR